MSRVRNAPHSGRATRAIPLALRCAGARDKRLTKGHFVLITSNHSLPVSTRLRGSVNSYLRLQHANSWLKCVIGNLGICLLQNRAY